MSKRKAETGDAAVDMEAEESSSSPPQQQEKQTAGGFSFCGQLRSSARVLRRKEERKESESAIEDSAATIAACVNGSGVSNGVDLTGAEKPRRTWGQWSAQDKATFFEALNEYGKNFVAIQSHFQNKAKKASSQVNKNKVQIRTFYYRTWHKIAKFIEFPDMLKKSSRELYGLINYGELRKKVGSKLDEKVGIKLQELVFKGHTTFRLKGKTIILRTPICRALKGISLLADKTVASSAPMPTAITLDLKPLRHEDFFHVHAKCYQNPHAHVKVSSQHRMGGVISLLENKWTPREDKLKTLLRAQAQAGHDSEAKVEGGGELWLVPPPGAKLLPLAAPAQPVTSATLSLASIQDKLSGDQEGDKAKETEAQSDVSGASDVRQDAVKEEREAEVGWSSVSSSNLSVGDLFLMLGSRDSRRIELYYTWKKTAVKEEEEPEKKYSMSQSLSVLQSLSRLAATELARKQQLRPTGSPATAGRGSATRSPALLAAYSPKTASRCEPPLSPLATPLESSPIRTLPDVPTETAEVGLAAGVEFRRPNAPPPMRTLAAAHPGPQATSSIQYQAFRKQMSSLLPRFCNRRGRTLTRKNVVSRQLVAIRPLHPISVVEPDGRMKLMLSPASSSSAQTRFSMAPQSLISAPSLAPQVPLTVICQNPALMSGTPESLGPTAIVHPSTEDDIPSISIPEMAEAHAMSPTGSSLSMFENSLTDMPSTPTRNDHFLDSILENSSNSLLQTPPRQRPTPPTSPSRAVVGDSWMPDLSLSSFLLGESPVKNLNEDSSHSTGSEVDRQLLSMMTESSVDFTAKFARLASHVSDGD